MDTTGAPVPATAVILPFLALITLILDIPPLVWHIRNHNLAASSLVFWIGINNLFNFINPIIWPTDDLSKWFQGYGLCDIEVKIIPASYIGVIGSLLGIMRNLAQVLDTRNTTLGPSQARKTRQRAINIFLCFGFPCIIMLFHYIVQARRYSIVTVMGCYTTYHLSWMSIVLIFMWPLLLSLIVVYYCILLVYRMRKYREEFSSVLSSSSSNLTKNRFMRLFIISATLIIVLIPTQTYILLEFARQIDVPWSWSSAHGPHWGDITLMPLGGVVGPEYWIQIVAGLLIFAFFGTGQDAQEQYRQWLLKLGLGRLFPALHLSSSERRHLKSSTSSQTSSFGSQMRILRKGLGRSSSNAHLQSKPSVESPPLSPPAPPYSSLPPLSPPRTGELSAAENYLLESLPAVHPPPSRFHHFFRAANTMAPERQMARGIGGFGASRLPRMDPHSRDYDPV